MNWFAKLRTIAPVVGGYAASVLAAWAVRKGYPLSDTEAAAIVAGGGHVLSKVIAAAGVNPRNVAAPSLVHEAPPTEVIVPVPVGPNDVSPYAAPQMPVIPLPTPAPNAGTSRFIEGYECPFCTGEHNAHYGWCKLVGGDGVAPAGFANDTIKIRHDYMRKLMADVESGNADPAVMAAVKQAIAAAPASPEPPAPRSPYLKPKVSEGEKPKAKAKAAKRKRQGYD